MLLKITVAILLQGLTLYLLGLSCEATSLGLSVIVEPLEDTGGEMVRAHFTAIVPNPCPDLTGVCAEGEDCELHLTSVPFSGNKPESGWCTRQWYKTVSSDFNGTVTLGSDTEIYVSMNAGPVTRPNNGKLNQPPYVCLPPPLRARVSCPFQIDLSVRDMDGDKVRCRFAKENQGECLDCAPHSFIELDEDKCTLTFNGKAEEGQHFIYLMAEDWSPVPSGSQITISEPLSAVPVHLSLSVEALTGRCSDEPLALPATPPENFKFDILPFQQVTFPVAFESQTESILEVAVVGPFDLQTANFTVNGTLAEMTIARVRHVNNNLPRYLPISFVANTESLQSEPRCVWLKQTKVVPPPLGTELECEDTQMTLVLPLATLTDVNLDDLKLNDPTCPINYNSTHLTANISFTGCGTDIEHAESELIYFNILQSKNPNTVITRKPILKLPLACRIPAVLSKGPLLQMDLPTELEAFGVVKVSMEIEVANSTTRRRRAEESDEQRPTELILHVIANSTKAERAEINVVDCIVSQTEDYAQSINLMDNWCVNETYMRELTSSSSMTKSYLMSLPNYEGKKAYLRCTANLCIAILPSKQCPNRCTTSRTDEAVLTSLYTKNYIVEAHATAPEWASSIAAGVIMTAISVFLPNLFLY